MKSPDQLGDPEILVETEGVAGDRATRDGLDVPKPRPGLRSARTVWNLLAIVFALECCIALSCALSVISALPGYANFVSNVYRPTSRPPLITITIHTDLWRLALYLLALVILVLVLGASSATAWRLARGRKARRQKALLAVVLAQPVLALVGALASLVLVNRGLARELDDSQLLRSVEGLVNPRHSTAAFYASLDHSARVAAAILLPLALCLGLVLAGLGLWLFRRDADRAPRTVTDPYARSRGSAWPIAGAVSLALVGVVPVLANGVRAVPYAWWVPIGPQGPSLATLATRYSSLTLSATGRIAEAQAVACPTPSGCIVFGESAVNGVGDSVLAATATETNQGWSVRVFNTKAYVRTLHAEDLQPALFHAGMACPTKSVCYLAGAVNADAVPVSRSDDGGRTWSLVGTALRGQVSDPTANIACMNASSCAVASGAGIAVTHDAGSRWTTVESLGKWGGVANVACGSATHCVGIYLRTVVSDHDQHLVASAILTVDGGYQWTKVGLPAPPAVLASALSCPGANRCLYISGASSGPGAVVSTGNAGHSWQVAAASDTLSDPQSLACPGPETCYLVRRVDNPPALRVELSLNNGRSWHSVSAMPGSGWIGSITCPRLSKCVIAATKITDANSVANPRAFVESTTDGGKRWRRIVFPPLSEPASS